MRELTFDVLFGCLANESTACVQGRRVPFLVCASSKPLALVILSLTCGCEKGCGLHDNASDQHRIDIIEQHTVRTNIDKKVLKAWTTTEYNKSYTREDYNK